MNSGVWVWGKGALPGHGEYSGGSKKEDYEETGKEEENLRPRRERKKETQGG